MIYKIAVKEKDFENIVNGYKNFIKVKKLKAKYGDYLLLEKVDTSGVFMSDFLVVKVLLIEYMFNEKKVDESEYANFEIVFNPIEDELRKKNETDKKVKKRSF